MELSSKPPGLRASRNGRENTGSLRNAYAEDTIKVTSRNNTTMHALTDTGQYTSTGSEHSRRERVRRVERCLICCLCLYLPPSLVAARKEPSPRVHISNFYLGCTSSRHSLHRHNSRVLHCSRQDKSYSPHPARKYHCHHKMLGRLEKR